MPKNVSPMWPRKDEAQPQRVRLTESPNTLS
jgi:hypothetical protein